MFLCRTPDKKSSSPPKKKLNDWTSWYWEQVRAQTKKERKSVEEGAKAAIGKAVLKSFFCCCSSHSLASFCWTFLDNCNCVLVIVFAPHLGMGWILSLDRCAPSQRLPRDVQPYPFSLFCLCQGAHPRRRSGVFGEHRHYTSDVFSVFLARPSSLRRHSMIPNQLLQMILIYWYFLYV